MKRRHHPLVALGLLAPACAPAPTAHRGQAATQTPVHSAPAAEGTGSAGPGDESPSGAGPATTSTTEAPTTTVTIANMPATTTSTVLVLPENQGEDESDTIWLIRQTFPETPDKAVRVARCESKLDPNAISPGGANWGVMQVNVVHRGLARRLGYSWDQMLQIGPNLAVARAVYDAAGGWGPWSCA